MASYQQAKIKVLQLEGGYQNNPSDSGNRNSYNGSKYVGWGKGSLVGTNWGISAAFYSSILKREVSISEMKALTKQQAIALYKTHFWDKIRGDEHQDQAVAEIIFDAKVNMSRGIKVVQRTLNNHFGAYISEDNSYGPNTHAAVLSVEKNAPGRLHNKIKKERIAEYHAIVKRDPSQQVFLQGWLNRMRKFTDQPEATIVNNNAGTVTWKPQTDYELPYYHTSSKTFRFGAALVGAAVMFLLLYFAVRKGWLKIIGL